MPSSAVAYGNVVDTFLDLNTADGNGTTLTTTILNNGTVGSNSGWSFGANGATGLTIEAHQSGMGMTDDAYVGTTRYDTTHPTRAFKIDHNTTTPKFFEIGNITSIKTTTKASMAAWITFGPPKLNSTSVLYDYMAMFCATGDYAALQLDNGRGQNPGLYSLNVETAGNSTIHTNYIDITPGGTYFVCVVGDFTDTRNGFSRVRVWNTNLTLVGEAGALDDLSGASGSVIDHFRFGNNEVGQSASVSYFENIMINLSGRWIYPNNPIAHNFSGLPPSKRAQAGPFRNFPPNVTVMR